MLQRSIRSWLWGSMLAGLDHIEYDDERLYVAALLHDVGLVDRTAPAAACFAVHGSNIARRVVIEAGGTGAFADEVADAIAAHFNVNVPLSWGAEARLRRSSRAGVLWRLGMERSIRRFQETSHERHPGPRRRCPQ